MKLQPVQYSESENENSTLSDNGDTAMESENENEDYDNSLDDESFFIDGKPEKVNRRECKAKKCGCNKGKNYVRDKLFS